MLYNGISGMLYSSCDFSQFLRFSGEVFPPGGVMGESFPHPVAVFRAHLGPPRVHIPKKLVVFEKVPNILEKVT